MLEDVLDDITDNLSKDHSMNDQESFASERSNVIKIYPDRPDIAYIIYVSLGKGCYRHIKIPCSYTFEDLHLHAFFLDNRMWSNDGYFSRMQKMKSSIRPTIQ